MFDTDLARLRTDYARLPEKDQAFALSLLAQHARGRGLSAKQWPWVRTLAERLDQPAGASSAARNLGGLGPLRAMFETAAAKLKFPHLLVPFDTLPGVVLKLWTAGPKSRQPGTISIVSAGPAREWFGRVTLDGTWEPGTTRAPEVYAAAADLLCELLADPQATLAARGKQAGACCYCGTELTDKRSVDAGYGPTCAKKWSLPWGPK